MPKYGLVAACVRRMLAVDPVLALHLDLAPLRLLPDLAAKGVSDAVRMMADQGTGVGMGTQAP